MRTIKLGLLWFFIFADHISAKPMPDLKELFLEIPVKSEFFDFSRTERAALITTVDKKNGFLEAKENLEKKFAGAQLAVFRKKDGDWLIGWRLSDFSDGAPVVEMFVKNGTKWVDVSKEVLPQLTNEMIDKRFLEKAPKKKENKRQLTSCASTEYQWNLPRKGTTITIEAVPVDCWPGPKLLLWNVKFNGKTFDLE